MKLGYHGKTVFDSVDERIIGSLQRDAKTSLATLGELVGLSAPSVLERVRRLEAAGVITGYHAHVDARQLGLDIAAFIGVSIRNTRYLKPAADFLAQHPEILECHHVTGGHTLILKAKTQTTQTLETLIDEIRSLEGVEATETMIVLSTQVERTLIEFAAPVASPARKRTRRAQ